MKRIFQLISALFLLIGVNQAQELSGIPGAFVDVGFGARPVAMGGAFVGLANDVNSVIWNPAGLATTQNYQVSFSYFKQMQLVNYQYFSASASLSKEQKRSVGVALIASGDEALREYTFYGSYAQKIAFLMVGINLKVRYASFGNNTLSASDFLVFDDDEISEGILNQVKGKALGFGLDIGVLYQMNEDISFGLLLRDMASPVNWDSETDNPNTQTKGKYSENVPMELIFGSSFNVLKGLIFAADFYPSIYEETANRIRMGVEGTLLEIVALRAGVQRFINNEDLNKITFGLGLNIGVNNMIFHFDYAYVVEPINNTQRFALSAEF